MQRFFQRVKALYQLYNFFQKKKLVHNVAWYKQYGLKKKYYSSVSSVDFEHLPIQHVRIPKLDDLKETTIYKTADEEGRRSIEDYTNNGYIILKKYFDKSLVHRINARIHEGLENGDLSFVNKTKIMFAFHQIPELSQMGHNKSLIELLDILVSGHANLFQSINFEMGSEQHTHSDSYHMTTYPLGGLLGVWVALEDIDEDNGPLHYYPGSHKLPYYMNKDYDNQGNAFLLGAKDYDGYEEFIEEKMKEWKLEKKTFHANAGDVLIWHANLFHGGEPHINKNKTRKSVVFHYFKEGCICYHEITQRPALMFPSMPRSSQ